MSHFTKEETYRVSDCLRLPSALLPLGMSTGAVAVIFVQLITVGPTPQVDEGMSAHVWQLLMGGQIPIVGYFVIKWARRARRSAFAVLGMQLAAALAALAPVYFLKW
jgi:hypothetical protein